MSTINLFKADINGMHASIPEEERRFHWNFCQPPTATPLADYQVDLRNFHALREYFSRGFRTLNPSLRKEILYRWLLVTEEERSDILDQRQISKYDDYISEHCF
jgi:hypothetical protein